MLDSSKILVQNIGALYCKVQNEKYHLQENAKPRRKCLSRYLMTQVWSSCRYEENTKHACRFSSITFCSIIKLLDKYSIFFLFFFSCRISPFISIIEDATCCLSAPDENHVIVWCRRWTSSFLSVFYDGNLKLHFSPCFLFAYVLQSLCFSLYYKRVIIQFLFDHLAFIMFTSFILERKY